MNDIDLINQLLLCVELEGNEDYSAFDAEEKFEMYNFLHNLKEKLQNNKKIK